MWRPKLSYRRNRAVGQSAATPSRATVGLAGGTWRLHWAVSSWISRRLIDLCGTPTDRVQPSSISCVSSVSHWNAAARTCTVSCFSDPDLDTILHWSLSKLGTSTPPRTKIVCFMLVIIDYIGGCNLLCITLPERAECGFNRLAFSI